MAASHTLLPLEQGENDLGCATAGLPWPPSLVT